jgi:hypothetical protein
MSTINAQFDASCIDYHIDYHKAMAATLIVHKAIGVALPPNIDAEITAVNVELRALIGDLEKLTAVPAGNLPAMILRMQKLHKHLDMINTAVKAPIRTSPGDPMRSLNYYNEQLLDLIERWQLSIDPSVAEATKQALEEYEHGETVSFDSLV